MKHSSLVLTLCSVAASALLMSPVAAQSTTRVSVNSAGVQGNEDSRAPSISADGRFVAFMSEASNLVFGDTNGATDAFVHDRQTARTIRVSVNSAGAQGNGDSLDPSISADCRFVAFWSSATNLVSGDTNHDWDIYVHDLQSAQTKRISVDSAGMQGNGASLEPSISADGRFVAFWSWADNLVSGDTNDAYDIFVHDLQTAQTSRVSVDSAGVQGNRDSRSPSISADGRFVAFDSWAGNLVSGDTNGLIDVFVHDRQTDQTSRVSVHTAGTQGNNISGDPSISADGRLVAFSSYATNLVPGDTNLALDVFVHDRQTAQTSRVSVNSMGVQGDFASHSPSISSDGRLVAFVSSADNLVSGDTNSYSDIIVHDLQTAQTSRVSVDSAGGQGDFSSWWPSISANGRFVAFTSDARNLVSGDTNRAGDVFVHDRQPIAPTLTAQGSCPGPMTLILDAATPDGGVAFALGVAGSFTLTSSVCAGTILDLANPRLGAVIRASWLGTIVSSYPTTPAMCGRSVQALDVRSCKTSNAVVL